MQDTNKQGLVASCCLTCSCWLTWLEARTCPLKTQREREMYSETARKTREESIGKIRRSWTMLDLTGFRLMRRVAHGRSQSLACREHHRRRLRKRNMWRRTNAFALKQWHVAFSGGPSFFTNRAGLFFLLLRFFPFFLFFAYFFYLFIYLFFWNATAYFAQFAIRGYAPA